MSQSRAVLSIVGCGLIGVGIGIARHRLAAQPDDVERLPEVDLTGPLEPSPPHEAAVTSAAAAAGQSFGDSGLSATLPEGLTARGVQAGANRIVRVERGRKLVVALNRGPLYPWVDKATLQSALQLKSWREGPVSEPVASTLPVDGWAFDGGRLHLLTQSTLLSISIAADGSWSAPEVQSVLQGLVVEPMRGIRESFADAIKLTPEVARGPASPRAVEDVNKALATIRTVPKEELDLGPITEAGIRAYEAGSLDHLDTLILLSTLNPFAARLTDGQPMPAGGAPPASCTPTEGAPPSGTPAPR